MNKEKLLIIIIVLIIIIIGIIATIITIQNGEHYEEQKEMTDLIEGAVEIQVDNQLKEVETRNYFYIVKSCINKFYLYQMPTDDSKETNDYDILYDLLDLEYIKYKGITKNNISNIIPKIKESVVNITDMYISQQEQNISVYIAKGTLREKTSGKISEFKIMVKINTKNRTFSVYPEDYLSSKYNNIKVGDKITIDGTANLEKNINNGYSYEVILDEAYVTDLFNKYKEEILYNTELAYKHLNEDYKQKRFATFDNFKEYAKNNIVNTVKANLDSYQKKVTNDYIEYICKDQNGKYYIFRETSVMNYSLILDTYTLELPEVVESYNQLTSMEKAGYNVQICIEAINGKDYSYVYNKLDDEFKKNNYKTEESFIKTIKKELFNNNEVKKVSSSHEGNTYIYNLNIVDKNNKNKKQNMTIIMQLKEGTDFVMSFSFT